MQLENRCLGYHLCFPPSNGRVKEVQPWIIRYRSLSYMSHALSLFVMVEALSPVGLDTVGDKAPVVCLASIGYSQSGSLFWVWTAILVILWYLNQAS
jgi:hypothetical protein